MPKIKINAMIDHLILIAAALFMSLPVLLLFLSSTHDNATLAKDGLQWTFGGQFGPVYERILFEKDLFANGINALDMLVNSIIVAGGVAILLTLVSLSSAYALVFFRLRATSAIFMVILVSMFFPVETRILPTFLTVEHLGLINSYAGIILPMTATALGTFVLRQIFRQVPGELIDAARIDGAGPCRFFIDILIPVSLRALFALFMILFVIGWNQYLWPLVATLSDDGLFTLVRGIERIGSSSNAGMALAILTILPPVILVVMLQSIIVEGLQAGGDK